MTNLLQTAAAARNRASAANRLPSPDPLLMAYATNRLVGRYGTSIPMARIVAEMVYTSLGDRR
jgi:hypothetical protein